MRTYFLLAGLAMLSGCFGSHGSPRGADRTDSGPERFDAGRSVDAGLPDVGGPGECEGPTAAATCFCDGDPALGDACAVESSSCGSSCFDSLECREGRWRPAMCPEPHVDECDVLFATPHAGNACEVDPRCSRPIDGVPCCSWTIGCVDGTLQDEVFCYDSCAQACELVLRESDCVVYGCEWTDGERCGF